MKPQAKVTRRAVLGAGIGAAGVALIAWPTGLGSLLRLGARDHLSEASYRPLVGSVFRVNTVGVDLQLIGVRHLGPLAVGRARLTGKEHFALDFEGSGGDRVASSLHWLSHPELGSFQLFLTPVGRGGSVQRYEATINRFEVNTRRRIDV
jgi:hypothetical protein